MVVARQRPHRWVMELSFHREIQMSTSLGRQQDLNFNQSEMARLQTTRLNRTRVP
jgi:hypothetical protein